MMPKQGQTKQFDRKDPTKQPAEPQITALDMGVPPPWRISLTVMEMQTELVFDLTKSMTIGRAHVEMDPLPEIDLTPFNGEESGVSRQHAKITLDEGRVVVTDLDSSNGTFLNEEPLQANQAYPLRNEDSLKIGILELKVELLMDPFAILD
jgi:pSer/pThr/pTyr-binding forkhead associated (FHA) protein